MLRIKQAERHGGARRLGMQRIPECTLCVLVCWMKTQAAACMANPGWEMQHLFILQENGWSGSASDVTMASFAEKAKCLSILHKLSGGAGPGGTSDGPFGNGGVFGDQGFERKRSLGSPNVEKHACHKCGEVGHIGRNCIKRHSHSPGSNPKGGGAGPKTCHRCGQPGHVAAVCDNERQA